MGKLKFNKAGWNELVEQIVDTEGVRRMQHVADACNAYIESDGYKVSVEGDKPLSKRRYRATVIATNAEAMADNARHNRLVQNLHLAGGN